MKSTKSDSFFAIRFKGGGLASNKTHRTKGWALAALRRMVRHYGKEEVFKYEIVEYKAHCVHAIEFELDRLVK